MNTELVDKVSSCYEELQAAKAENDRVLEIIRQYLEAEAQLVASTRENALQAVANHCIAFDNLKGLTK